LGKAIIWDGIKFIRMRPTEWAAGQYSNDGSIMMITHDGVPSNGISCLVPPQRIQKQAMIDLTDERLGKSFAEQIKFCGDCAQFYPATPNYFHLQTLWAQESTTLSKFT
jgi:hypothetical protein